MKPCVQTVLFFVSASAVLLKPKVRSPEIHCFCIFFDFIWTSSRCAHQWLRHTRINNVWLVYKISEIHATAVVAVATGTRLREEYRLSHIPFRRNWPQRRMPLPLWLNAFSLSRKVLPPCMQEQQGPRSASVSISQQTQHQPDGVSQNQERRSWICKLLMSQFWSLNIAGVFPVGQHWLWPFISERQFGSRDFYQNLQRDPERAGRLWCHASDRSSHEGSRPGPPELLRGGSCLSVPAMHQQRLHILDGFFLDWNGCRSNSDVVFSFSLSLKLPAWWRSCPTSTWSWTMACVSAERKVSRPRRQRQEATALLSLSSSAQLLASWVIFSRITAPSPTIAFTFRAPSLFFPCCQLGHLLSSTKVPLTNHRAQVDYPTGWKAISRWDMFDTKVE